MPLIHYRIGVSAYKLEQGGVGCAGLARTTNPPTYFIKRIFLEFNRNKFWYHIPNAVKLQRSDQRLAAMGVGVDIADFIGREAHHELLIRPAFRGGITAVPAAMRSCEIVRGWPYSIDTPRVGTDSMARQQPQTGKVGKQDVSGRVDHSYGEYRLSRLPPHWNVFIFIIAG